MFKNNHSPRHGDQVNLLVGDLSAVHEHGAHQAALNEKTCAVCTVVHGTAAEATACEDGLCPRHSCGID
jgi:hypothetical protein